MAGILAIILFVIWMRRTGRKHIEQALTIEARLRAESEEGSREDYLRAYQGSAERKSYGHWQDPYGGGDRSPYKR